MIVKFSIVKTGWVAGLTKRRFQQFSRTAWANVGYAWLKSIRPKHFTRRGATEYGYEPREGEPGKPSPVGFRQSYTGRKLKKFGHTRPLEYSGVSKTRTRALGRAKATANRVTIRMNAPALNFKPIGRREPLRRELTAISDWDIKFLAKTWIDRMMALIGGMRDKKTVRT